MLLKIDLRKEAQDPARKLGSTDDDEEQAEGLPAFVGRAFRVGDAAGQTVGDFEKSRGWAVAIERLQRGSEVLETTPDLLLRADDIVFVRGRRNAVIASGIGSATKCRSRKEQTSRSPHAISFWGERKFSDARFGS
ncbi:TrkA C-terminal domain-containing protein [Rhizobium sp. RCAM05350]|nr:TrkA C-terminal domain-containing protein [Rhizobium sp. RCAM05350]